MKKMLSMIMAIAMVASLAVTAFADESFTVGSGEYPASENVTDTNKAFTSTIKSKVKAPTIKVTIPTTNNVYLNPYKMSVALDENNNSNSEIVSIPTIIKSETDCKLAFSAVVTGKASTGVTLEKASVKKDDGTDAKKTNSVYMYVYFTSDSVTASTTSITPSPVFTADTTHPNVNAIVVSTTASKNTKVMELADGSTTAQYGAFIVAGDIVAAPDTPWTEKHTVDVTVALSIAPVQASTGTGTGTGGTGTGTGGTGTGTGGTGTGN